jgi:hypothetical protein
VSGATIRENHAPSPAYVNDFVSSSDGLRLIKAFRRISDAALRRKIVSLLQQIAPADDE